MKRFGLLGFLALLLGGFLRQAGAVPLQNNEGSRAANTPQSNRFLSLNGTDQYVEIPHDPALNPTGAFTIEAWVKRASGSRCETIISKGYTTAYWLGFCSGAIRFYASGNAPGDRQDGITPIPADVWTHIAVVYHGSGRRYYINGELDYLGGPELAPMTNSLPVRIGSDPGGCTFYNGYWDSSLTAVSGSDERLWLGNNKGDLFPLAQRWQQLDDNGIGSAVIQDVWTARGRTFLAGSSGLYVLQPDGETWDNRSTSRVWDVLADDQGRIWTATNTGIRLYTATGWDYLTDKPGTRPATAVYALAEDGDGRLWIGGLNGLTLFDRERFIATFTPANSALPALPITTLFSDRSNRLWAGGSSGLASSEVSGLATDNADRVWFSHAPDPGVSIRGSYLPRLGTVIPQISGITPGIGSSGDVITINGSDGSHHVECHECAADDGLCLSAGDFEAMRREM